LIQLLAIYDKKARIYKNPWPVGSIPEAVRTLSLSLRQKQPGQQANLLAEFPDDYQVVRLGEFDEATGRIHIPATPEILFEVYTLASEEKKHEQA